jgi:hypothetical protein
MDTHRMAQEKMGEPVDEETNRKRTPQNGADSG